MIIKSYRNYIDVFTSPEGWEDHTRFLYKNAKLFLLTGKRLSQQNHKRLLNYVSNHYLQRKQ